MCDSTEKPEDQGEEERPTSPVTSSVEGVDYHADGSVSINAPTAGLGVNG